MKNRSFYEEVTKKSSGFRSVSPNAHGDRFPAPGIIALGKRKKKREEGLMSHNCGIAIERKEKCREDDGYLITLWLLLFSIF